MLRMKKDYSFLLSRAEHRFDEDDIDDALFGKRVLVTGAGGTIGSAIVRRLLESDVSFVGLVGHSELPIFNLRRSLGRRWACSPQVASAIADIGDVPTMRALIDNWRPDIIFHAAAHKHVGLMETQPHAAFKNNTLATVKLARVAIESNSVRKFVFISTDKAVAPTSVMGASKRFAEVSLQHHFSPFVTICRFGNVLGSSGSLVEIVEKQIASGDPVTINDPRMKRFFITEREAVGLVLTAGLLEQDGGVFSIDMGEPVLVDDVVRKLCYKGGHTDIVTGAPGSGEKTEEVILGPNESAVRTANPAVLRILSPTNSKVDEAVARVSLNPYSIVKEAQAL